MVLTMSFKHVTPQKVNQGSVKCILCTICFHDSTHITGIQSLLIKVHQFNNSCCTSNIDLYIWSLNRSFILISKHLLEMPCVKHICSWKVINLNLNSFSAAKQNLFSIVVTVKYPKVEPCQALIDIDGFSKPIRKFFKETLNTIWGPTSSPTSGGWCSDTDCMQIAFDETCLNSQTNRRRKRATDPGVQVTITIPNVQYVYIRVIYYQLYYYTR